MGSAKSGDTDDSTVPSATPAYLSPARKPTALTAVRPPSASTRVATAWRWPAPRTVPRAHGVAQSTSVLSGSRTAWIVKGSTSARAAS